MPLFLDGEKISGSGFDGLGGDVGREGRRNAGRWCAGAGAIWAVDGSWRSLEVRKAGCRGIGTLKRWEVELCAVVGVGGEEGVETRRRFVGPEKS